MCYAGSNMASTWPSVSILPGTKVIRNGATRPTTPNAHSKPRCTCAHLRPDFSAQM